MFPELKGVTDPAITKQIIKLTERSLPITTTARNIEYEFYWEEKCKKELKNIKPELHGCSYKQAYIETHVQKLLENFKGKAGEEEIIKELRAARNEVFCLIITQLKDFDCRILFKNLPNLSYLTVTFGAKHVDMEYERQLFGMKMSEAQFFRECIKNTSQLTYLALPGNLIDDDLVTILNKGLMLNKTITQLDLSHNKIGSSGARKIAKYVLHTQILTHLNLSDNCLNYEASRFIAQACKANRSLVFLSLKLNRLDDKAGSKFVLDLLNNKVQLREIDLSANLLGNNFCESLSEYLKLNEYIQKLDISCNFIEEGNAATLKDSLENNPNVIKIDVRNNKLNDDTVEEINEIVMKNYLTSKNIPYKDYRDCK